MATYHGAMAHPRWLLLGAVLSVIGFALFAVTLGGRRPGSVAEASGSGDAAVGAATGSPAPTPDRASAAPTLTPVTSASTSPAAPTSPTASPATARPSPVPPATRPPRASGAPHVAWIEFLSHLNDDRSAVDGLNRALESAASAQDLEATRTAAVAILDFLDTERDWLQAHPPADCYADAHASAGAMLDAYANAAERFVDWTATRGGLAGLPALGVALDAAKAARDVFTSFGTILEGTTCPG
jgi:hypothetical protein